MKRLLLGLLLVAGLGALPSAAGLDIDFGATITIGNDDDLFLSVSARYFNEDRHAIDRVATYYRDPDDIAVALFIAQRSGKPADRIHALRSRGISWWDISVQYGLPASIWFVAVDRDPGPPYGKAYGHWKHHKRDKHHSIVLTDADVRNLVAVRVLHEYYGVSVSAAMEWRSSGRDIRFLVSNEYNNRHKHNRTAVAHHKGPGHGKQKQKNKHKH